MLALALLLSVLIHVTAGGVWSHFGRRILATIARVVPQPKPTPELVAISDAITISKRTVPHASRRAQPTQPVRPQPRRVAVVPTAPPTIEPTMRPTVEPTVRPTMEPTRVPTPHPVRHATVHLPRPVPSAPPAPRHVARNRLTPQQIAAMESQFAHTIAQTQGGATDVEPQREPPSARRRFDMVMKGTQRDLIGLQGQCHSIAPNLIRGMFISYYLACAIVYGDGYAETAVIPWPMTFRIDDDPMSDGRPFPPQGPPPGYAMPQTFELSRFVCLYYRPACANEISRERAAGAAPP
ncbi:MAG TPA: hypothetical protein VMA36_04850 [Candidatus Limnocylindria bacterium]|nr:hypothetical protein [Candidatus Limnocylindria bacterium]